MIEGGVKEAPAIEASGSTEISKTTGTLRIPDEIKSNPLLCMKQRSLISINLQKQRVSEILIVVGTSALPRPNSGGITTTPSL